MENWFLLMFKLGNVSLRRPLLGERDFLTILSCISCLIRFMTIFGKLRYLELSVSLTSVSVLEMFPRASW